jgi:UTP-glucose-1-phosphate uridylyltransferase
MFSGARTRVQNTRMAAMIEKGKGKKPRSRRPIFRGYVMTPARLKRLRKELLEFEQITELSDDMRELIEKQWPELAHKLPPKTPPS